MGADAASSRPAQWKPMDSAPRDGSTIEMKGHIDTVTRLKSVRTGLFDAECGHFITTSGWILFPDAWRPVAPAIVHSSARKLR